MLYSASYFILYSFLNLLHSFLFFFRVKIEKDIANEEEVRNDLRIRMKELQDNENNAKKQSKMWQDLKELMRVKNECFERRKELILHPSQEKKDHLIL